MDKKVSIRVAVGCCIGAIIVSVALVLSIVLLQSQYKKPGTEVDGYYPATNGITAGMGVSNPMDTMLDFASDIAGSPVIAGEADSSSIADNLSTGRKLIRKARASVETTEYDRYIAWLNEYIISAGGYFERKDQYNSVSGQDTESRNLDATIRIPVKQLDAFLNSLSENGKITNRQESQEDITATYTDTDAHLESLRIEQTRLNELLGKAETVEDILAIEDRLSYVRYEIESYERQLRGYDSQIEYSVVSVDVIEVNDYTEPEPEGFVSRCIASLSENLQQLSSFIQDAGVFVFGHIPTLVILAVCVFVCYKALKWFKCKQVKEEGGDKDEHKG